MSTQLYYKKNKETVKEKARLYYKANREKRLEYARKYREENKELFAEQARIKNANLSDEQKKRRALYAKERWKKLRIQLLEDIGGCVCKYCGWTDYRALHIDHINGGGRQEMINNPKFKSILQYGQHIRANIKNYQVLCANCNSIKRYENDELKIKKSNI